MKQKYIKKNSSILSKSRRKQKLKLKKTILITSIIIFLILIFFSYALFWPSSQIFGKTIYKLEQTKINQAYTDQTNVNQNKINQDQISQSKIIALTFDDGPGTETEQILDVLKETNVSATFFVVCNKFNSNYVGQASEKNIELLKRINNEGHTIGLHGNNHFIFESFEEINHCKDQIEYLTGQQIKYYRPPYGIKIPSKMQAAKDLEMMVVTWSLFPRDYSAKNTEIIIKRIKRNLNNNDIICLHDGPAHRENTLNALPNIINYAKTQGYTFTKLE